MTDFVDDHLTEQSTALYTCTLLDELGTPIPVASLIEATLTLFDKRTQTIINNRDNQSVLNTNNVTINSDGVLAWALQAADNVIVNTHERYEVHVAQFKFVWGGGQSYHTLLLYVDNLQKV